MADFVFKTGDLLKFDTSRTPVPIINVWKINGTVVSNATTPSFQYTFNNPGLYSITHDGKQSAECNFTSITKTVNIITHICYWVYDKGGILNITIPDVITVAFAHVGVKNIGFIPTNKEVIGIAFYYVGLVSGGNTSTGCSF